VLNILSALKPPFRVIRTDDYCLDVIEITRLNGKQGQGLGVFKHPEFYFFPGQGSVTLMIATIIALRTSCSAGSAASALSVSGRWFLIHSRTLSDVIVALRGDDER